MAEMMNRLLAAMNAHDLDAFVECFASDYRSEQPIHPGRAFAGREQVRDNWTNVFAGIPDFHAELIASGTAEHDVEIGEWHWRGNAQRWCPLRHAGRHGDGGRP